MTTQSAPGDLSGMLLAVEALRGQVSAARLPLDLPDAPAARAEREQLLDQFDDYVLPRLRSLDAPLLAVVGGSTGAGKSTLVNSVVGAVVSRPGVLRPTTRAPVLVHHPDDEHWFTGDRVLPGLGRVTGSPDTEDPSSVRLVATTAIEPGLALLDAPDIDSVVEHNRELAAQLLAAADLWIFVTTAARYADAVPWRLLQQAAERGTSLAIVLDRVAPESAEDIREHLSGMLKEQWLALAPVFTVPEVPLGPEGLLPPETVARLRSWLTALAGDARARTIVVRNTLTGALGSLEPRVTVLADATEAQLAATAELGRALDTAFAHATEAVERGVTDGTLLRGEVLARWQELVGTGEFFKQVETTVSRWRDRVMGWITGRPAPAEGLGEALHSGVATLVTAEAQAAVAQVVRAWRGMPGGSHLLEQDPDLTRLSPEVERTVEQLVRRWQDDVLEMVRNEGQDRRTTARVAAYGVNAVGVVLMLVTFAHTAGITGTEVGIAGGAAVLGQKLLEASFGDEAVRRLAAKARRSLLDRVADLYAAETARLRAALEAVAVPHDQARRLTAAAQAVKASR